MIAGRGEAVGERQIRTSKSMKGIQFLLSSGFWKYIQAYGRTSLTTFPPSPQKPPTLWVANPYLAPLCDQLLVCAPKWGGTCESGKLRATRKTDQYLWAREKPQAWTIVPSSRKQKKLTATNLVGYKNQRRPKSLRIVSQEEARSVEQVYLYRGRENPGYIRINDQFTPPEGNYQDLRSCLLLQA